MSRLKDLYQSDVVPALMKEFGYKSVMEVPRVVKITLNMGVGEGAADKKAIENAVVDMEAISGQKAVVCLARKSVVMRANTMMFLSDDGVYSVEFLNDYNLRGAEEPISKKIQPYIDRINKDYADRAVGILFDNRYYLAVPLDSVAGANDARGNNSILVFNFLNKRDLKNGTRYSASSYQS